MEDQFGGGYTRDNQRVTAEGNVIISGDTPIDKTCIVEVNDEKLNIEFSDTTVSGDTVWVCNGIIVNYDPYTSARKWELYK